MAISIWDIALIAGVSAQATLIAYVAQPRVKAFLLAVPVPFTLATLAQGVRVNVTHLAGLALVMLFILAVRDLHNRRGIPIVVAILASAAGYVVAASSLVHVLPRTEKAFWIAAALIVPATFLLWRRLTHSEERAYRTPLPVWIKLPIVMAVVVALVYAKNLLQGFMAMFPMVGVVATYESRHCLLAVCRQMSVFVLSAVPLIITAHVCEPAIGLGPSLIAGWLVFLCFLLPLTRALWATAAGDPGPRPVCT